MYAVPAAPCPETKDRCSVEVGQPLTDAAPAVELAELVDETLVLVLADAAALWLDDVAVAAALLEGADELVVELEAPQAARAMASTAASGARPSGRRGVLTAPTLAKPLGRRWPVARQPGCGASREGAQSPR
jgi:hypothetical protein